MSATASSLDALVDALRRLPGVGVKSAQRMAYHLLQHDREGAVLLSRALSEAAGRVFLLDWPREALFRRIESRVDTMLAAGLIDETTHALAAPGGMSRTARQGLGYREVIEMLAGTLPREELAGTIKTHTRQFAKRQGTWFRSLEECSTIPMTEPVDSVLVAQRIYTRLAGG